MLCYWYIWYWYIAGMVRIWNGYIMGNEWVWYWHDMSIDSFVKGCYSIKTRLTEQEEAKTNSILLNINILEPPVWNVHIVHYTCIHTASLLEPCCIPRCQLPPRIADNVPGIPVGFHLSWYSLHLTGNKSKVKVNILREIKEGIYPLHCKMGSKEMLKFICPLLKFLHPPLPPPLVLFCHPQLIVVSSVVYSVPPFPYDLLILYLLC